MRRDNTMRLLYTILAGLCAALCITLAVFWIRSYWYYEGFARWDNVGAYKVAAERQGRRVEDEISGRVLGAASYRGSLTLAKIADPTVEPGWFTWSYPKARGERPGEGLGALVYSTLPASQFSVNSGTSRVKVADIGFELPFSQITLPYFLLCLVTAAPPWFWLGHYRLIARRQRQGRCLRCGHELKGAATCSSCGETAE